MNKIEGRIIVKESRVGIPDLLVVVYDVDPKTQPEELIVEGNSNRNANPGLSARGQGFPGDRIGSVLTDEDGYFRFMYEDEEFQIRNPQEQRPDLFLLVLTPEETGSTLNSQVLYVTSVIRQNAGRTEQYLIRLSTDQLRKAGIPIPSEQDDTLGEPESIIHKIGQAVERRAQINQEVRKIAAKRITIERQRDQKINAALETRMMENLTNVPTDRVEQLNYVLPSSNVEQVAWNVINKEIDNTINPQQPTTGYIVIPTDLLPNFRDNAGNFRDDISSDEIEPFLFGSNDQEKRPTFLSREDPISLMCESQALPDMLADSASDESDSSDNNGATPADTDIILNNAPASPEDVPEYIARLMEGMTSPEQTIAFGVRERASQDDIDEDITTFQLRSGPADVAAFHDFHSLQIAFDYVWQHAIDDEVIEATKKLYHQVEEMGGDALTALQSGQDPIKALRTEIANIHRANITTDIPNVMYKDKANPTDYGGAVTGSGFPWVDMFPEANEHFVADPSPTVVRQPHPLLDYLEELLKEPYAFTIYAPGSTNFGLMTTYRLKMTPDSYQVGNLIKTLPLTPGEERKITSKTVVKKDRNIKEIENSLRVHSDESSETGRIESEILRTAQDKTNFSLTAKGTYNLYLAKGQATTKFGKNAASSSKDTKKTFRENVFKAANKYTLDHKLEVEVKDSLLDEDTETAIVKNMNDELTVTYLFYELQRRYIVTEHIHRLTPVVLVAMDVPNPSRKTIDSLLLKHGWIINRVLLDDTFRAPLTYLSTRMVGDEIALQEQKKTLDQLRKIVDELKQQHIHIKEQVALRYSVLERALASRADLIASEDTEGFGEKVWEWAVGSGDEEAAEAARLREEAAKEAYEKAAKDEKELRARFEREVTALNAATEAYTKDYAEHLNRRLEIGRLRVHVKENILYYMQAIWSTTFEDQIFFMLHKIKVPTLTAVNKTYTVSQPSIIPPSVTFGPDQTVLEVNANITLQSNLDPDQDFRSLAEVADLDNPLGFKGNYMIFPLKESNPLIDYMMMPYVDSELGLHDPDGLGNWTPSEFTEYVACLQENLDADTFDLLKGQLRDQFKQLLSTSRRAEDMMIVPSGSLYVEALVGTHPLIEDFKLLHRAFDVKKVQAEIREMELENIRAAARLLAEERDDPDIDKQILIKSDGTLPAINVDTD